MDDKHTKSGSGSSTHNSGHRAEAIRSISKERFNNSVWMRYGLAVIAVAAAYGLRLALTVWVGPGLPPYITFYPAVMIAAMIAGLGPGVSATALACWIVAYWLLPPVGQLTIASPVDRMGLTIFTGICVFMSVVADLYRRNRVKAAAYDRGSALRESHETVRKTARQLTEAQKLAHVGVWEWQADTDTVTWTEELYHIAGLDPARPAPSYKEHSRIYTPDSWEKLTAVVEKALKTGEPYQRELELVRPDGSIRHVNAFGGARKAPDGHINGLYGTVQDITERKQSEEALRRSEELLQRQNSLFASLLKSTPMGVLMVEVPSMKPLAANVAASVLLGRGVLPDASQGDLTELYKVRKYGTRDPYPQAEMPIVLATKGIPAHVDDMVVERPDGTEKVLEVFGSPVTDDQGRVWAGLVSFLDITERKLADDKLLEITQRLQLATSSAKAGVWDWNLTTNEMIWDDRMFELYGLTRASFPGGVEAWKQGLYPDDASRAISDCEAALRGERAFDTEFRVRRPDGTVIHIKADGLVTRDETGKPVRMIGMNTDITERKRTEKALKLAKEAAEQANRAKSLFLATMSHELRTPLNPILGFAELLTESPNLTNEQRTWLRIIAQRGQDLLGLIGSVLDLAKIEADKVTIVREPLLLRQTVRDLVDSILPAAEKKELKLECDVAAELPAGVLADGMRLRQVLLNLLNNALKFTERGSIVVRVQDGRSARLMRKPADGEAALLFSVRDTGIGIAADRQAAIFEAFTQADRQSAVQYGGTGLGLTIASRLVELMGGCIWVESAPGQGSTFWFTLLAGLPPVRTEMAAGISTGASKAAARRPLNVLIVEDDPASLSMAEFVVREAGHRVRTALDGKEAVSMAESEAFDLIIMDIQMPIMDGIEATRRIRERESARAEGGNLKPEGEPPDTQVSGLIPHPSLPTQVSGLKSQPLHRTRIIALTAFAMEDDREKLLNAGMDDYLSKPVLAARLREALKAVV